MIAPTRRVFVDRSARAAAFGTNRRLRMAASTRTRTSAPTDSRLLSTRDTDAVDTPASRATSANVDTVSVPGARLRLRDGLPVSLLTPIDFTGKVRPKTRLWTSPRRPGHLLLRECRIATASAPAVTVPVGSLSSDPGVARDNRRDTLFRAHLRPLSPRTAAQGTTARDRRTWAAKASVPARTSGWQGTGTGAPSRAGWPWWSVRQ